MAKGRFSRKISKSHDRLSEIKKNGALFNVLGLIPLIWGSLFVLMVLWGFGVSIADENWYLDNPTSFIPFKIDFSNYKKAMEKFVFESYIDGELVTTNYFSLILNSLWFSIGMTATKMISTVFFAYAVARLRFPGRKFLYVFVVLQMMIPVYGQTAANYQLLDSLGLLDSPLFLIGQGAGHGMYFLIVYAFFRNLPTGYAEAAQIDGAGPFTVFFRVMLPQARPIIVSLSVMQFISAWNSYDVPLLYLPSYPTLSTALYLYKDNMFQLGLSTPTYFAGMLISIIPVAVLFLIFNKQIMNNISIGGMKG